jgi:hypothetical protein
MNNKLIKLFCLYGQLFVILFILCFFIIWPAVEGEDGNAAMNYVMIYILLDMIYKHFDKKDREE